MLLKAYKYLANNIRNRDVHGYVPNVRDGQFHVVLKQFAPSFNLLISWLPSGPNTLNEWLNDAPVFIESLA